ncbi:Glyoxalase-like domain-containing protein [Arboricoccus pini]|uniref:Glyoxalase-like domain-containing protein n=1 Tax=Arboricoccus pini TaxID=1963835 RepID=A0A212QPU0_9PROT|nr:VOC family protein [Arboricoccus pini]SNB61453.1 Glyoxalase-like domain-containing protein [Arboricoccus pini]
MATELDHLVVGASSLEQGIAYVESQLGVQVPRGGRHEAMLTHNAVMSLGPNNVYFEILAIEPGAPAADAPRWFGMDDPALASRLAERPRLIAWVARTDELAMRLAAAGGRFGQPADFRRDSLSWKFGLHPTGLNEGAPATPVLIEWPANVHPAPGLADLGVRLEEIILHHPDPAWLRSELNALDFDDAVTIEAGPAPALSARFKRPDGSTILMD